MELDLPHPANSSTASGDTLCLSDLTRQLAHISVAAQLYNASGLSVWMNEANRALLGLPSIDYAVSLYNVLTDPWSLNNGYTSFYRRAFAGELVYLPETVVNLSDPENAWETARAAKVLSQLLLPLPDRSGAVQAVLVFTVDKTAEVTARADIAEVHERLAQRSLTRTAELAAALARLELEVAARQKAEAALADREALTQALFASASVGMALADPDGRMLLANEALAHFLEVEPADLLGLELDSLIHPDDRHLGQEARNELLAGRRRSYMVEQRLLGRRGATTWGHLCVTLLRDDTGAPRLIVLVCEDITERVRADEERARLSRRLREAERLESLGLLAGGVAHDFNNILTSIQGNSDLALLSLPDDSPARQYLEQIGEAVAQASALTRQMFAYAGQRRVTAGPTEINEAIGALGDLLRASHTSHCHVRFQLSPGLPPVAVQAAHLRQIVMNLVVNAAEAIGEGGGEILVRTDYELLGREALDGLALGEGAEPGPFVRVTVHDTGCGIAPDTLERIFDPFFTTKLLGRGLGLASVHTIVRSQRGALWVESALGRGTTFKVWLPAVP